MTISLVACIQLNTPPYQLVYRMFGRFVEWLVCWYRICYFGICQRISGIFHTFALALLYATNSTVFISG